MLPYMLIVLFKMRLKGIIHILKHRFNCLKIALTQTEAFASDRRNELSRSDAASRSQMRSLNSTLFSRRQSLYGKGHAASTRECRDISDGSSTHTITPAEGRNQTLPREREKRILYFWVAETQTADSRFDNLSGTSYR